MDLRGTRKQGSGEEAIQRGASCTVFVIKYYRVITSRHEMEKEYDMCGRKESCIEGLGERKGKKPLARLRHRWKDNINIYFQMGCTGINRIDLAQNRKR